MILKQKWNCATVPSLKGGRDFRHSTGNLAPYAIAQGVVKPIGASFDRATHADGNHFLHGAREIRKVTREHEQIPRSGSLQ